MLRIIAGLMESYEQGLISPAELGDQFVNIMDENHGRACLYTAIVQMREVADDGNYINADAHDAIVEMLHEIDHWSHAYCYHDEDGNEHTLGHKFWKQLEEAGVEVDYFCEDE